MQYDVKISDSLEGLIAQVNEVLSGNCHIPEYNHWRLQGGIAMTATYSTWENFHGTQSATEYQYAQALVRG